MTLATMWAGEFGDEYIERNQATAEAVKARTDLWREIYKVLPSRPPRVLEVGSNIGLNLRALRALAGPDLLAIEPNRQARETLIRDGVVPLCNVKYGTASDMPIPDDYADLVFTSGVLIHIDPAEQLKACREMYRVSRRYIVCIEYFSDKLREVPYRGQRGALWTRDYGSLWLDNFKLKPLSCGFAWKRVTGLDNLTWWAFEK